MNSTSCILLITLLVIVVVGVCMSHPAGKAGMAVGCQAWSDCPPENYCAPFDANNAPVPSGAAGTCVPRCDGPDSCEKKGACQFWRSDLDISNPNLGYCYSTEDQPCGQTCVRSHEIVTGGGKAAGPHPYGPNGPPDGKIPGYLPVNPVGGKAGFASYPGEHSGPYPFGPNGPTDGKVTNLLTGGQHRTGGKAGMAVGIAPKPKSNCQTDQDCPGYDGSSETMCISNSFVNGVNVCTPKCVGTDPESCGFKGRCESVMPFTDGKFTYYYCNAKDKKHPCTESCYNANPL